MATVFILGFLATNAEPALNVLGQTVETLSNRYAAGVYHIHGIQLQRYAGCVTVE
jgi:hypothetical protein